MKVKLLLLTVFVDFIVANGLLLNKDALIATLVQQFTQIRQQYENVANQFNLCKDNYQGLNYKYDLHFPLDVVPVNNSLEPFGMSVLATTEMYLNILKILQMNVVKQKPNNETKTTEFDEQAMSDVRQELKITFANEMKNLKNFYDERQQNITAAVNVTLKPDQQLESGEKLKRTRKEKLNESAKMIKSYNDKLIASIKQLNETLQNHLSVGHKKSPPTTCQEAMSKMKISGVYEIKDPSQTDDKTIEVNCENDYDGGGWLVIQQRKDGSVNFDQNWSAYEHGFGEPNGEYWLGLQRLHKITTSQCYELYIKLTYWGSGEVYLKYDCFRIADRSSNYQLSSLGTFEGNGEDILSPHLNRPFSTSDHDNDLSESMNCAAHQNSGWWYNGDGGHHHGSHDFHYHNHGYHYDYPRYRRHVYGCCGLSLNEYNGVRSSYPSYGFHCHGQSIEFVQMMIRRKV